MTDAQKEDVRQRAQDVTSLVSEVRVSLLMGDVYRDNGDAEAPEACLQTARRALDRIGEHLAAFRELTQGGA